MRLLSGGCEIGCSAMKANRSFVWRAGILFSFIAVVYSASVANPHLLASNEFLMALMGPDLVAVLIVVLTITFASVANIHLSISRMVAMAPNRKAASTASERVRGQINSNAWAIFWAFVIALIALFVYGQFPKEPMVRSLCIATCLTVVVFNGLVMHDLYRAIFILATNAPATEIKDNGQDFSDESPPAG